MDCPVKLSSDGRWSWVVKNSPNGKRAGSGRFWLSERVLTPFLPEESGVVSLGITVHGPKEKSWTGPKRILAHTGIYDRKRSNYIREGLPHPVHSRVCTLLPYLLSACISPCLLTTNYHFHSLGGTREVSPCFKLEGTCDSICLSRSCSRPVNSDLVHLYVLLFSFATLLTDDKMTENHYLIVGCYGFLSSGFFRSEKQVKSIQHIQHRSQFTLNSLSRMF